MYSKQFYLIKACEKLPQDVIEYIWKLVKDDAANKIASAYFKKVAINVNFFQYLLTLDVGFFEDAPGILSSKCITVVNKVIKNNMYKITYKYIQEPGTWIEKLEDILDRDSIGAEIPPWDGFPKLNVNNIHYMLNSIKNNNEIYRNTGIEWWQNF